MAEHTPGPWRSCDGLVFRDEPEPGRAIADCRDYADAEAEANARLIAAAPELLAALTLFEGEFGSLDSHCGHITKMTQFARAAIAKATGGPG